MSMTNGVENVMPISKKKLPACFYQKAFWVVIPMLMVTLGSSYAAVDAQINGVDDRLREVEQQVAENNVPNVKEAINKLDDKLDEVIVSQARIEQQLTDMEK